MEPVPVTGLAANFSPMLRMAPPPLGNDMEGGANGEAPASPPPPSELVPRWDAGMDCFESSRPAIEFSLAMRSTVYVIRVTAYTKFSESEDHGAHLRIKGELIEDANRFTFLQEMS